MLPEPARAGLLPERPGEFRAVGWWAPSFRIELVGPVLVVAMLYAVVIGGRLQAYDGNVTGFVVFGQQFAQYTHHPAGL